MFKIRVRWRTALALCLWALSVSWIPSSAVAGSECGSGAPVVTQRAPWGGKSSPREGAAQVVVRMMVTAGEMRAGEPENGLDAERRRSLRQQVAGDPPPQADSLLQSARATAPLRPLAPADAPVPSSTSDRAPVALRST